MSELEVLAEAFVASAWRRPDTTVCDEPAWFETRTPSSKRGNHNSIRRCTLSGDALRARIRGIQRDHRQSGTECRWTVTPLCVEGLGDVLVSEGFEKGWTTVGMIRDVSPLPAPDDVRVEVTDDTRRFATTCGRAWLLSEGFVQSIADDMALYLQRGNMEYVIARVDGEDVGTAHTLLVPRSGYLMGGAVLPTARGRGVYRAMVSHRLDMLRARGVEICTVLAVKETSAPILPRLGFTPLAEFQDYIWRPPQFST